MVATIKREWTGEELAEKCEQVAEWLDKFFSNNTWSLNLRKAAAKLREYDECRNEAFEDAAKLSEDVAQNANSHLGPGAVGEKPRKYRRGYVDGVKAMSEAIRDMKEEGDDQ